MTVQPGDAATWVEAFAGWASVAVAYWTVRRQDRAVAWGQRVDELAGLAADDVVRRLQEDEELEELLWDAMEAASRASSDMKREALAKAAAAALRGDFAAIDEARIHARTLAALDEPHVQLFALIVQRTAEVVAQRVPPPRIIKGNDRALDWSVIEKMVPASSRRLARPIVNALQREGLIDTESITYDGKASQWALTPYGVRMAQVVFDIAPERL